MSNPKDIRDALANAKNAETETLTGDYDVDDIVIEDEEIELPEIGDDE